MNNTESQTPINSFTLAELIDLAGEQRQGLMRECITASSDSQMQVFRFPCRIDAFIIGVGTEGETSVSFNLHEFRLKKDSMFIFTPKNILQVNSQQYFKADVIAISPDFMRRINIDIKNMMPLFLKFVENPTLALTPEESRSMRGMIAQIERETRGPETHFSFDIVSGLIAATIYKVGDIMYHYLAEHPEEQNNSHNRAEEYFKQFTHLLGEHFREERSVGFYARQLCITPKYLTTLIKRISGQSVSEWIDNYVILEAKTLLKYSTMSIQEIAYYLNFPNQSFFGSYFKRNTGMSDNAYPTVCTPACIRNPGRSTAPGFVVAKPRQKGYPTPKLSAVFFQRRLWIHRSPAGLLGLWSCTPQSSRSTANLMSKRRPSPVLNPSCL